MRRAKLVNERFGRLLVQRSAGKSSRGKSRWQCLCSCGRTHYADVDHLRGGFTRSCGCLRNEAALRHGHTARGKRTPEFHAWVDLRQRCGNPNNHRWRYYGARGISVCKRWESFSDFFADMGERPGPGYSIDRVNNEGNYEPSNCRWATRSQQARNRRKRSEMRKQEAAA